MSLASSGGRAAAQNSGNTGAPGDATVTCGGCHATNSQVQITIDMSLTDENGIVAIEEYIPGATYDLNVTINNELGTPAVYGFQLLALKAELDQEGEETSEYTEISSNAQKSFASNTGRNYLEHDGPSESNEFSAKWTAPEDGSGPVSFYLCGNGANDNGNTQGDNIACSKIQFNESDLSSINSISGVSDVRTFPNPTTGQVSLEFKAQNALTGQLTLINLAGQHIENRPLDLNFGESKIILDLSTYENGIYILQLATKEGMITRKIVKN